MNCRKKSMERGRRREHVFRIVCLLLLTLTTSSVLGEIDAPPPKNAGNPLGGAPTDGADFEDDDFIDPGSNNLGFPPPDKMGGAPPPPPPPPMDVPPPEPSREAPAPPTRPSRTAPPSRVSGRTSPPPPAPTTRNEAKSGRPAPKLADYLELDPSVKGLEVKNFDLPDKDIKDVVTLISKWTGKNFILDSKVRGKITIIGPSQVTLQEAYQAFLSALDANGLTTVQSGKFIRIIESAEARRAPVKTYAGDYAPKDDQFITRVFQLKYINADEVQREFRDLTTRQGKLFAYEPTNSIIITDTGSNIQRIKELLETLDVKSFETTLHVLKVKNSSAKVIADMLGEIYGEAKGGAGGQARSFRRSALERTRGGGIITKIIPDEQTNSLVVLANQSGFESLKKLVGRLDVKVTDTGRIHVYYCEHAKAEDLAQTLASLAGGGPGGGAKPSTRNTRVTTGPQGAPGGPGGGPQGGGPTGPVTAELEGGVKITSDAATNSLVITANSSDYQTLKRVIRKLDIPRLQVFVETAILEVTVNDQNKWGTNLGMIDGQGRFRGGFTTDSATDITNVLQGVPLGGATVPIFGPVFKSDTPGAGVQLVTLTGLLNFISTNSNTSILSTPQIIALDNEKAEFKVQDEIPVAESFNTPNPQNPAVIQPGTIGKKKTGIDIKLTPHINAASRIIRLEIDQTVDTLNNQNVPGGLGNVSVGTTTRQTNTQVVVKDGDFVALGGLMSDQVDEVLRKVPLLGDIPILGWLFKGRDYKVRKTNLVILLQPRIIGTAQAASNIIKEQMKSRDEFIDQNMSGDRHEERVTGLREKLNAQQERSKSERGYDYKNSDDDEETNRNELPNTENDTTKLVEPPKDKTAKNAPGEKSEDDMLLPLEDNAAPATSPSVPTPSPANDEDNNT